MAGTPATREHVLPKLTAPQKTRAEIAADLVAFAGPDPEWWAYFGAYDWVALCQLYGPMVDLPKGWPMFCRELEQLARDLDLDVEERVPVTGDHHALADAAWTRSAWEYCESIKLRNGSIPGSD